MRILFGGVQVGGDRKRVIRRLGFYTMKKLPAEQREIIPGAAYSMARLYSLIGIEAYDRLLEAGLTAVTPNGRDYWYLADDVLALLKNFERKKPAKLRRGAGFARTES